MWRDGTGSSHSTITKRDLHFGTLPQVEALPDFLISTPLLKVRSRVIAGAQHPLVRKKNVTPACAAWFSALPELSSPIT